MRIQKLFLPFLLTIVVSIAIVTPASACPCGEKKSIADEFASASLVFVGRVEYTSEHPLKPGETQVKLYVIQRIKGFEEVFSENVTVYTPKEEEKCSYPFAGGLDYLVYASGNPAHLKATSCSRTEFLDKVGAEVKTLSGMKTK